MRLLRSFERKHSRSPLLQYVFEEGYQTSLELRDYPRTVTYADKALTQPDTPDGYSHLGALHARALAYAAGCDDPQLQTPQASEAAQSSAAQGILSLERLKPSAQHVPQELPAETVDILRSAFNTESAIASAHLKGESIACVPVPVFSSPDPGRFDRILQGLSDGRGK